MLPISKADDNKQLSNESLFECFSSNAGVALKVQYVSEAIFDFVKYWHFGLVGLVGHQRDVFSSTTFLQIGP